MATQERVAIVGSGLAGLVSAHLLHGDKRKRYAIKIFESVSLPYRRFGGNQKC
jgi:predicted NAD/FAD-binding protein